jgi:serine/threonine protein kinase
MLEDGHACPSFVASIKPDGHECPSSNQHRERPSRSLAVAKFAMICWRELSFCGRPDSGCEIPLGIRPMKFTHQPGATPVDGFTIRRGIHRGGFGEVYYAVSDAGKEVALKLLQHEQEVELRGVRQCLNLKHPNLVNLFDVKTDAHGESWVVMEYVNGSSLEDVLASFPNGLPLEEVGEWLSGIVAGVGYLHNRGIVHRDLKPANVYRENGTVKVGDIGLSKRLGSDRRGEHTQSVGTVYYMAPEVAKGQYGPEVDVYSLGVMLYEMLTGQLPFMGESTAEVLMKHLTATASLNGIPERLRPVVSHALAKDPRTRTPSVMQLDQEFRDALGLSGVGLGTAPERVAVHAANGAGAAVTVSHRPMSETPSNGVGTGLKTDTAHSMPAIGMPPAPTKSSAQAASAYGQYPPDQMRPERPGSASTKPPPPPPRSKPSPAEQPQNVPSRNVQFHLQMPLNWPLLATIMVGLLLFSPGSLRSWSGIGLMGAACFAASVMRGRNGCRMETGDASLDPSSKVQICDEASMWRSSTQHHVLGDAAASLTVGSVSASLFSVGALLASEFFQRNPQPPSAEFLTLFTATSLAATWLVLMAGQFRRRFQLLERNPRRTFLVVGFLAGAIAFGLQQYLLVDFAMPLYKYSPAFKTVGIHRLIEWDMNPTWLGYAVFFGGLLFWHRWWLDMSARRHRQLSFGRLGTAAIAAWLLTMIFAFPQWPAILWAITISASVQLATPWSAPQRRPLMRRG